MVSPEHVGQQFMDLYHFTRGPKTAEAIRTTGKMKSRFKDEEGHKVAYFTDNPKGPYSRAFGEHRVDVQVPAHLARYDEDGSPDSENHYTVRVKDLKPEHFKHG